MTRFSVREYQRANYYQLTAAGRKQLTKYHARWTVFVEAVSVLMKPQRG